MEPLALFFSKQNSPVPTLNYIGEADLPKPHDFLLTQPLLTQSIADYYQRTPKIRPPLHFHDDVACNNFYRAVLMIIDNDVARNDALVADAKGESTVVELGLITMNYAALPQAIIDGVRKTQIPFGALLIQHQLTAHSINTRYFNLRCDNILATYLQCQQCTVLYGRSNTLVRDDNQCEIAQVVEILAGVV